MILRLCPAAARGLRRHAAATFPREACGLLARGADCDAPVPNAPVPNAPVPNAPVPNALVRYAPVPNTAADPRRFAMDPLEVLRVERRFRTAGLRLGAVFHSHPYGQAVPSAADLAAAALWPELFQVILALGADGTRAHLTAFRFAHGTLLPVETVLWTGETAVEEVR